MNDVTGKELKIGDVVAHFYNGYRGICNGIVEVIRFTEKRVCISVDPTKYPKGTPVKPYSLVIITDQLSMDNKMHISDLKQLYRW